MKIKCKACDFEFDCFPKKEIKFGRMVFENVEICDLCTALRKIQDAQLNLKKLLEDAKKIAKDRKLSRGRKEEPKSEKANMN